MRGSSWPPGCRRTSATCTSSRPPTSAPPTAVAMNSPCPAPAAEAPPAPPAQPALPVADRHYIDGEWREPASAERVDIVDPATGARIAEVPRATPPEADAAIRAARRAFDE